MPDDLSIREIKFIIKALAFHLHHFNQRLEVEDLDRDEEVYIRNDSVVMQDTLDYLKTIVPQPYYSPFNVCE